jgi:hypothetical protein
VKRDHPGARESVAPTRIDRVQNVNTEQCLRERLLRVATVDPATVVAAVDRAQASVRDPDLA